MEQWVLVCDVPFRAGRDFRVVGPFSSADEAGEARDLIGIPLGWEVVRLMPMTY